MLRSSVRSSASPHSFVPLSTSRWLPRAIALLVWLCAGFVLTYVVLHWMAQRPATLVPVQATAVVGADTQAVARALGAQATQAVPVAPVAAPSRYVLTGVVAPAGGGQSSGVALIAIDGQRPGTYRVGAVLDGRWAVQTVERRSVVLRSTDAPGQQITLALPELAFLGMSI